MSGEQRWQGYEPTASGEPGVVSPPPRKQRARPTKPTQPTQPTKPTKPPRIGAFLVVGFVVLLVGFLSVMIYLGSRGSLTSGFDEVDALSAEGLAELTADVEERTGRTEVFDLSLYPTYAVLSVTVDATSQREDSLQWDGDLEEFGGKGTATTQRFDLTDVDIEVVLAAVETAKTLVEDPETWSASITDSGDEGVTIRGYASNEYSESGYVEVTLDGTEIRRITP